MLITGNRRLSRLAICIEAAPQFQLTEAQAREIVAIQIATLRDQWEAVCDDAELSQVDRAYFWGRQFLNPYAFEGAPDGFAR